MSATFVIAPYTPEKWSENEYNYQAQIGNFTLDLSSYKQYLENLWTEIEFNNPVEMNYAAEWRLPPPRKNFAGLAGKLSKTRQIVVIGSRPKEQLLEFVLSHRRFVPVQQDLYLFGSFSNTVFELKSETTIEQLVRYTGIVD